MDRKLIKQLIRGTLSHIPGMCRLMLGHTGGTDSARYCYSVWFRHLLIAWRNGLETYPKVVGEIGPGDSIGVGLIALISGADHYYGLDVVPFAASADHLNIFDELVSLFEAQEDIPGDDEFPNVYPRLTDYRFPAKVFNKDEFGQLLSASRIDKLRKAISQMNCPNEPICYLSSWESSTPSDLPAATLDFVFSQAALQYIEDLQSLYKRAYSLLRPGGIMSNQIDFSAHQTSVRWNGHWTYSNLLWSLLRGKLPFWLNRQPHSVHLKFAAEAGFRLIADLQVIKSSDIKESEINPDLFNIISPSDLTINSALIQFKR